MAPYFLLFLIPTIIWIISDRVCLNAGNRILYKTESLSMDVFMLFFLLMLSLRGLQCGNDTIQYFRLFDEYGVISIRTIFENQVNEIGFKMLIRIVNVIAGNYQIFLAVTALLCVCPLWYFYRKESEIPLLTIALFLTVAPFTMYFSGIRQAISMAMGILAWYAVKKRRIVYFLAVVFLAIQFHTSALMLLLLYPMYYAKITKKWIWFVIPCIALVYVTRQVIFDALLMFLWKDYEQTEETGAIMILLLLIIFSIYSYAVVDDEALDRDTMALRNILLLSVVLQIFAMLHPLSMRMNYYFLIFLPILIPKIAKRANTKYKSVTELSVVVMIIFFYGYFIRNMLIDNDGLNIFPYIPFWENA